ncbi:4-methylaminobutanoate oxidase (formaldehyde-forming) [Gemmobacter caeni]|uniref:4-methylaminobutanoate oxidase (Formaldehyde-forming) n=2 Tax=Gemmobacter TaxID=204456 RepID=A0A2T6ATB6_9RHOB|nr:MULTISPECIES: FAD-dependent oxidoreductase [Gemmobacter]PTX47061.1 4-methylaminobutanoate oxidase (formaldehyde-forming) [Gemmobacter caeni]TWI96082.1 4-methylaminobutanoate oxidase (formaldehyde-forming) [Gemmobacter caeni]GHC26245.1 FAD-dependent oxidoreductase [Gemmobacter nanjingensis]
MTSLPSSSKVVIVGGGIVGCSTAYHLAKMGVEVVLLERKKLTSGTTFHAAGLVGQARSNANVTQLLGYSIDLYKKLEAETGQATGWKMNGGLRLACNEERWTEVKRQATTAHSFGLDMQLLSPQEAQDLWPLMDIGDVVGAAFLPTDGQANPSDITLSLAKGARMAGAQIFEDVKVLSVDIQNGVIRGVVTEQGRIDCEKVVVCAGMWTRPFCAAHGVNVPLVPVEHQYIVTERIEGVTSTLPTLRDPDRLTYWKEEVGGLVMGGYEPNPKLWRDGSLPPGFHYTLLDNDFDHFTPIMELALGRVPALERAGVKQMINGPESFTPDGMFILGEAPEQRNFFVGAGFNAFGIASGGGAGMALAEWVAKGQAPFDLWPADIRRFGRPHFDTDWIRSRTYEAYGKHYTMAWPSEEHHSARPCRKSPLYDTLKADGAVFGEKLGWERPNWFADLAAGEGQADIYTFQRPNWHDAVGREHRACREAAVLFDQTSFAKFALKGPDAEAALQWIAANDVGRPVGSLTYTQMLNDRGGIEADLTVVRRARDEFYIVTGTGFATRDFDWISRNIPAGMNAQLFDITSAHAVLSLMGPRARAILQAVTRADVSNAAFPFGTAQTIGIAGCPVLAMRVTYVGELGWELHFPVEYASAVYAALHKAGAAHGLRNAGYRAIETLRLEKGYRAWGAEIGPDHTPDEAGLGWAVKLKKDIPFRGREAVAAQRASGVCKMMATFTTSPDIILSGRETIYRDGQRVGWLSSGGFGHTLGRSIGMGYVRNPEGVSADYVLSGRYELEVATIRVPAEVSLAPLYDPKMARVKA